MGWTEVSLILGLVITLLGFIWGIIKVFKKPPEDKSWEKPMKDFIVVIEQDRKDHRAELEKKFKETEFRLEGSAIFSFLTILGAIF